MTTTQREALIEKCKYELAVNFDCPAPQILRVYAGRLGMSSEALKKLLRDRVQD